MSYMSHSHTYEKGDKPPEEAKKGELRVYGMKFCPFVHRLKLVMHAVGADHETINCNTVNKPEWLFDKNPRGKVPVIELNGDVICESDVTSRYINSVYGKEKNLVTEDPWRRAKEEVLMGDLDKATAGFFKHGKAKDEAGREEGTKLILESFDALVNFLNDLKKPFIGGESPGFNDYMFWPFMQRIALRHKKLVDKNATVKSYCEKMLGDESVKACRHPDSLENKFWDGYFLTGKPEYNIY